jgi:hypothetical protein
MFRCLSRHDEYVWMLMLLSVTLKQGQPRSKPSWATQGRVKGDRYSCHLVALNLVKNKTTFNHHVPTVIENFQSWDQWWISNHY